MKIGILALQGAVGPHEEKLRALGVEPVQVRRAEHLQNLSGIILPGGESTTMLHVLKLNQLFGPLREFAMEKPAWGVCAGTILLAKKVSHPSQDSLELLDIDVERNAFGRQIDSFIGPLSSKDKSLDGLEGVFIRAPRIRSVLGNAKVVMTWKDEPVMVEEGHLMATTFHPELSDSPVLHTRFLETCRG